MCLAEVEGCQVDTLSCLAVILSSDGVAPTILGTVFNLVQYLEKLSSFFVILEQDFRKLSS